MSAEAIKVGDLVQVVRWSCCNGAIGAIFVVASITSKAGTLGFCTYCKKDHESFGNVATGNLACVPVAWLRRIPPPEELISEEEREELHELA